MGYRWRARAVRSVLLAILSLAPQRVSSQALLLPPFAPQEPSTGQGFLTEASPWAELRHFPPDSGGTFHSYVLDFGSTFTLYALGPFSLQGMVRQILLTRLNPESEWLFWPAALYTDLRLAVHADVGPWDLALAYRHDCKHDIEAYLGRDAAHDTVALTVTLPYLQWEWPAAGLASRLAAEAEAALNTPFLFQWNPPEPDRFTLSAGIDWEPLRVSGWPVPFVSGGLALIARGNDTRVTVRDPLSLDGHLRGGLRIGGTDAGTGTLSVYAQWESLSDDWMILHPVPATMVSCGLLLGF